MSPLPGDDEDRLLRSVLHQNAESILIARQRAERELELAKEALEVRTFELATSLALMHATLEATADGILASDQRDAITGFNTRFLEMWHVPRDLLVTGSHAAVARAMAAHVRDPAGFMEDIEAMRRNDQPETFDVLELADGRVVERYTRVQRIGTAVIGRVWSYRDVTQRASGEAALRKAMKEAEAANRAKGTFLAMMSHELRTPLNAIAGYAELIELGIHGAVTEQQHQALSRIRASQRHLLGLIDELLTHAKLETGHLEFELGPVSVRQAIEDAHALVAMQATAKGVSLVVAPSHDEPVVLADREKLHQILLNLMANAVKFTTPGGRVEIGDTLGDGHVLIRVRDTGIGIPPEMLQRIFEPFVQVRSELTRAASGTGLGLAISLALARGMNGDLLVDSAIGQGSTFTIVLPVDRATA